MFVSVVLDPSNVETSKNMSGILVRYGFKKIQRAVYENMNINESQLNSLKNEFDTVTDYYDVLRMYQFPVNGNLVVTELQHKKWQKCVLSSAS